MKKPFNRVSNTKNNNESISESTDVIDIVESFTIDSIKDALPKNFHTTVNQSLVDNVNKIITDEEYAKLYRENLITYQSVLLNGKYTVDNYLDGVAYCSFKLMGLTDKDAYYNAFPDRVKRLRDNGKNDKTISAYVSAYSKGKLVVEMLHQATIPNHLLYRDVFHSAIMEQATLMRTALSEKVRCDAANSLLTALKQPETSKLKIETSISGSGATAIESLANATRELVTAQRQAIQSGSVLAKTIAEERIVEAEYVES